MMMNVYSSQMVPCAFKDQIHPCSPRKIQEGPISTEMVNFTEKLQVRRYTHRASFWTVTPARPRSSPGLLQESTQELAGSVLAEPGNHLPFGHNEKPAHGRETCNITCLVTTPSGLKRNFRERQYEIYSLWESQRFPHICRRSRGNLESCLIPAENSHNTLYRTELGLNQLPHGGEGSHIPGSLGFS